MKGTIDMLINNNREGIFIDMLINNNTEGIFIFPQIMI
jgi:hypothetical protein